jgi:hypothetical protein
MMLHQVYWVEHNVSPHDYYLSTLISSWKHIDALNKNSQNFWHHPFICRKRISSLPTPAQNVEKMLIRTMLFLAHKHKLYMKMAKNRCSLQKIKAV